MYTAAVIVGVLVLAVACAGFFLFVLLKKGKKRVVESIDLLRHSNAEIRRQAALELDVNSSLLSPEERQRALLELEKLYPKEEDKLVNAQMFVARNRLHEDNIKYLDRLINQEE